MAWSSFLRALGDERPANGSEGPSELPDEELLARAKSGDVVAFEQLVERHQNQVYALALRMMRSEADAAEVTQETFFNAYQGLAGFRGDAAFGSWVHRIAANQALMRLRHKKVREGAEGALAEPEFTERGSLASQPAEWAKPADAQALDAELGRAIQQATDQLPEGYREVFLFKDVEGLSYEEIAEALGITVPAVKSRLHRARLALRGAIDQFYGGR